MPPANCIDPAALITPGAIWQPGSWTPARCALWHQSGPATRARLEAWVMAEHDRGRCNPAQLPKQDGRQSSGNAAQAAEDGVAA